MPDRSVPLTIICAGLMAVLAPASAQAKGLDTPRLVEMCKNIDPNKPRNAAECIAYLRGVYEGGVVGFYLGQRKVLYCPGRPIARADDLRQIFLRYVKNNPTKEKNDPAFVATKAFTEAYPCKDDGSLAR